MGTFIKNMKTPKACGLCSFRHINMSGYLICEMLHKQINLTKFNERFKDCPLVEVKEPHGRLIDADKLNIHDVSPAYGFCVMGVTEEDIELADTVIEAEGET